MSHLTASCSCSAAASDHKARLIAALNGLLPRMAQPQWPAWSFAKMRIGDWLICPFSDDEGKETDGPVALHRLGREKS